MRGYCFPGVKIKPNEKSPHFVKSKQANKNAINNYEQTEHVQSEFVRPSTSKESKTMQTRNSYRDPNHMDPSKFVMEDMDLSSLFDQPCEEVSKTSKTISISESESSELENFVVEFQFDKTMTINHGLESIQPPPEGSEKHQELKQAETESIEFNNLLGYSPKDSKENQWKKKESKKVNDRHFYRKITSDYFKNYPKVKPTPEQNFDHKINMKNFYRSQSDEVQVSDKSTELINESDFIEDVEHFLPIQQMESKPCGSNSITIPLKCLAFNRKACDVMSGEERIQYLKEKIPLSHCSEEEVRALHIIFDEFSLTFQLPGDTFRHTDVGKHQIILKPNTSPINQRQFRIPEYHKPEIQKQIQELVKNGIISKCDSPWNSPIFLVPKKANEKGEKQYRMVIDYRELNKVIEPTSYPMPNIDDILDKMDGCKYFTVLDLYGAYHQIPLEKGSRQYTAFSTSNEKYCFNSIPFGLTSSPYAWLMAIQKVLMEETDENMTCLGKNVFAYMDDIILCDKDLQTHIANLCGVLRLFRKHFLKLRWEKCKFLASEVTYLGFIITTEGLKTDPKKTEAIRKFPCPKNVKQVQSFLGMCNYYRRYIIDYAGLARPLYNLCRKEEIFKWDGDCEYAFRQFKEKLSTPPILVFPDFTKQFILRTDCSMISAAGVLSQGEIPNDNPIHFFSKVLNPAQTRYSTIEKELLAIILSIEFFHYYLIGREFLIVTDHRPLTYLFNTKNMSARLHRWRYVIMSYQFQIVYKSGKSNVVADALSRIAIESDEKEIVNPKIDHNMLKMGRGLIRIQTRAQRQKEREKEKELSEIQEKSIPPNPQKSLRAVKKISKWILLHGKIVQIS